MGVEVNSKAPSLCQTTVSKKAFKPLNTMEGLVCYDMQFSGFMLHLLRLCTLGFFLTQWPKR